MTVEAAAAEAGRAREDILLRGRLAIVYALGRHFLLLPFSALCMSAALVHQNATILFASAPLLLQFASSIAAIRLKDAFDAHGAAGDAKIWARRYTLFSAFAGAVWGLGAFVWFVPNAFAAQAYLVLAYFGVSAIEFVTRGAYRPAYLAHASLSMFPLATLLVLDGGIYAEMTAALVLFYVGVLYSYCGSIGVLLDQSILLRHDNAQLIVNLSEENSRAETARDAAQASEKAKSIFISSISHELRTPLNAILGMAQLLERSELGASQRDHVKVVLEAGRGLKILLDDIIALAQHGEDTASPPPEEGCDPGQAARTVARLLQPSAWEKRLRLSVNVASHLPHVAADPRLLRRVLLKLTGNAIKFTERGHIEIAVDRQTEGDGQVFVRFRVTDTGPGIPSHIIGSIFEPFAKADESYARRYNGAGVGLTVAKRLVESMAGTVGVESEPGSGASFWIKVPATQGAVAAEHDNAEDVPPPRGLSILAFVPDEAAGALDRVLTPFGNRIDYAESLSDAAGKSARGKYAIIVACVESTDALAALPGQNTPILALRRPEDRQPDGADTILRWPASSGALYAAIAEITGGNKAEPEMPNDDGIIDGKAFADLEKSLGVKTLIDILQSYMATAEELATALSNAIDTKEWPQAARLAQDFAGAAGGLGLAALTAAARSLAQGARDGSDSAALATIAGDVLAQHTRTRDALRRLYPDLAA